MKGGGEMKNDGHDDYHCGNDCNATRISMNKVLIAQDMGRGRQGCGGGGEGESK